MPIDTHCIESLQAHYRGRPVRFPAELEQILMDRFGPESVWGDYSDPTIWDLACATIERYQTDRGRMELLCRVDELEAEIEILRRDISHYMMLAEAKEEERPFD